MMKINKQALIEAIDDATKNAQAEIDQYETARAAFDKQRKQDWSTNVAPAWSALATLIRDRLRRRQPITLEDVEAVFAEARPQHFGREGYRDKIMYWTEHGSVMFKLDGETYNHRPTHDPQLVSLRRVLLAVEDDAVTPTALKQLGFENLEWLFRRAIG